MDRTHGEFNITEEDWVRLCRWSEGYDAGWRIDRVSVSPLIPPDQPDYVAGFARGQRDRLDDEREHHQ